MASHVDQANRANGSGPASISREVATFHRNALVCDMLLPFMYGTRAQRLDTIERYRASGVDFVSLTVAVDWHGPEDALRAIAAERALIRDHDTLALAETVDDIRAAKRAGKLAVNFHFQGTNPLGADLRLVEAFHALGVRHMLIAYNNRNLAGDGCFEPEDAGLSAFGRDLVREMNRVGMMIDGSHTGYRTTMDLFDISDRPVVFTHANPRALWDNPRNISDDQIKACAATGGVIGINGLGVFLGDNDTSTETLLRHIDYVVELVGPQAVGLGLDYVYSQAALLSCFHAHPAWAPRSDYDGRTRLSDIAHIPPERLPEITGRLLARGYSQDEVRGILGENWMRVAKRIWEAAP